MVLSTFINIHFHLDTRCLFYWIFLSWGFQSGSEILLMHAGIIFFLFSIIESPLFEKIKCQPHFVFNFGWKLDFFSTRRKLHLLLPLTADNFSLIIWFKVRVSLVWNVSVHWCGVKVWGRSQIEKGWIIHSLKGFQDQLLSSGLKTCNQTVQEGSVYFCNTVFLKNIFLWMDILYFPGP